MNNKQEEKLKFIGTDGSLNCDGSNGCGIAFCSNNINNKSWRCTMANTNLGAELESILKAIWGIPNNIDIIIVTDSLTSINPIICNIKHLIKERKGEIIFEWIPSHQTTFIKSS